MSKFSNSGKSKFLDSFPNASLDLDSDPLTGRCKFNFAYFEVQEASQAFSDLEKHRLIEIFDKLKEFSKESLEYWHNQRAGKHGKIFSIYGKFPTKSDFRQPKNIPHQVNWGRFRLDWASRLCGFSIPKEYDGKIHRVTGKVWCSNTFYVVFLDENHRFYKGSDEKK
jgi:hypothetical protein